MNNLFTIIEISKILKVSEVSIRRLIKSNRIGIKRVGRRILISQNDLDEYLISVSFPKKEDENAS